MSDILRMDGSGVDVTALERVARRGERVDISPEARERIERCAQWVAERVAREDLPPVYGLNTGFGFLRDRRIEPEQAGELSRNLIESHSAGVGEKLDTDVVRGAMMLRANTLCHGVSGVRFETVKLLADMLNSGLAPLVPSRGSVGASGDLSPLSHIALAMTKRESDDEPGPSVVLNGELMNARKGFAKVGLTRVKLGPKEGLALNNGMQVSASLLGLSLYDGRMLLDKAIEALALTYEAMCGLSSAYDPALHELRPHPGQVEVASRLRKMLEGSELIDSRPQEVQDTYSLRCAPQVLGACMDSLAAAERTVEIEFNAASDNPLLIPDGKGGYRAVSGGNFHGEPVGLAADNAKIAISEMASLAERWTALHIDPGFSRGLPPFLARKPGLHSGLMIAQYTAAGLVSENKVLCHPSSVDSIPTGAGYEDFVSMGSNAALHCYSVRDNAASVIGIALFAAREALRLRLELLPDVSPSPWARETMERLDELISPFDDDRPISNDFAAMKRYVLGRAPM
ncbi:MAG: histidine ammonia-lyase [Planctomycetota bacterium]|nr:histidine ammonia-lyase [Planctomycetota bacterium]